MDKVPKGNAYPDTLRLPLGMGLVVPTGDNLVLVWAYKLRKYKLGIEPEAIIDTGKDGLARYSYHDLIQQLTADLVKAAGENNEAHHYGTKLKSFPQETGSDGSRDFKAFIFLRSRR